MNRRAHFFRAVDGACANGKPPKVRKRGRNFPRSIADPEFSPRAIADLEFSAHRGNAGSVSRVRYRGQHELFRDGGRR